MPWCAGCDRFLSPNTVRADGTCPSCDAPVEAPLDAATPTAADSDDGHTPIPWHLWLLIAALVVYLGYRAFQGLELLF
jgi:hypothetical protein